MDRAGPVAVISVERPRLKPAASGEHSRPEPMKWTPKFRALGAEPSCAGPCCSAAWPGMREELAKDHPMLSFLLVLTTVVAGAVLARIGVEKALLPKLPSGPFGS